MVIDKTKKLLVPFVVTLLYSVPVKFISGYYSASDNLIRDIFIGQLLIQGNTHLWFLPTLFIIFVLIYPLEKYIKIKQKYILFVLFALSFVSIKMPITIAKHTMDYLLWFYLGGCFEDIRTKLNKRAQNYSWLILWGGAMILIITPFISSRIPIYPGIDIFAIAGIMIKYISAISGCMCVYLISLKVSKTDILDIAFFKMIRNNTFGLYLYTEPLNYLILSIMTALFGNFVFVTNQGAALIIFGRLGISFVVGLGISLILRKLRIKYIC